MIVLVRTEIRSGERVCPVTTRATGGYFKIRDTPGLTQAKRIKKKKKKEAEWRREKWRDAICQPNGPDIIKRGNWPESGWQILRVICRSRSWMRERWVSAEDKKTKKKQNITIKVELKYPAYIIKRSVGCVCPAYVEFCVFFITFIRSAFPFSDIHCKVSWS